MLYYFPTDEERILEIVPALWKIILAIQNSYDCLNLNDLSVTTYFRWNDLSHSFIWYPSLSVEMPLNKQ